ncbi:MAG: hypothetical protein WKG00_15460 [Polyangiaceae bacterium]
MVLQHQLRGLGLTPAALVQPERGHDVAAVVPHADVGARGGEATAAVLEDVPPRSLPHEGHGGVECVEGVRGRRAQAELAERVLSEGAVELEAVAERAAADDGEALGAELVLRLAERRPLEDDEALASHPGQPFLPATGALDEAGHHVAGVGVGDVHADLVAALQQAHVQRPEVGVVTDTEDAHRRWFCAHRRCATSPAARR